MLEIDSLEYNINGVPVFRGVYLACKAHEVTGLLVDSVETGSLLMQIAAWRKPALHRHVAMDGRAILKPDRNLIYLPTGRMLPAELQLIEAFKLYGCSIDAFEKRFPNFKANRYQGCGTLSSGERRMAEIYLCLNVRANVFGRWILLDQPFQHLSPVFAEMALELCHEARTNAGILITDTKASRLQSCHRHYRLVQGQVQAVASFSDL
jgi:ABC-type branched-subunit amino acid transport system ATPase component